jgi:D-aminoacyl-tRNA deacylase
MPTMFVELGSSSTQWNDLRAAEVVAHAAMEAITKFDNRTGQIVLGIGGLHYNAKFTQIALESNIAFGHMIPKYAIPEIDALIIKQCIERTLEKVDHVVLDWKGIKGENKSSLVETLHKLEVPFEKV